MPQYKVEIPGQGAFNVESDRPLTDSEAYYTALKQLQPAEPSRPEAHPESGFVPALESGIAGLKGSAALTAGKLGLMNQDAAQKYYEEQVQHGKDVFAPTTESWSQAPFTKFKELAGSSLPYMVAPLIGAAAAPEAAAVGALGLGAGEVGAGLASLGQFTGTNLARQVDENKSLQNASLGSAAAGALPQAVLDVFSLHMLPGVRSILGKAGIELTEQQAAQVAKQGLSQTLASYGGATLKAMGAEGLTEAAQQFFERLQAGLSINDPEARQEYYDNFLGGAVLGGALAPVGHAFERSAAKIQQPAPVRQPTQQPGVQAPAAQQPAEEVPEPTLRQPTPEEVAEGPAAPTVLTKQQKAEAARQKKDQEEYLRKYAQQAENRQAAIAEYQRVKDMSPEEYALEQMQGVATVPKKVSPTVPQEDETGYYTQPPAPPAPHETYAAQQMALAKDREAAPQIKDYLDYLMQDPKQAQALLENRTQIPGVTAKQSEALLGGIKMQLKARADAAAKAEAARVSIAQERARSMFTQKPEDLLAAAKEQPGVQAQAAVKPEAEALQRIGQRPNPYLTANRDIENDRHNAELADKLVQTLPLADGRITPGDVYLGLGQKKQNYKDLQAQLAIARLTGNRALQGEIKRQLDATRPIPTEGGLGTEEGRQASETIARSKLPQLRVAESQADEFAADQRNTLLGMARLLASKKIMLPGRKDALLSNAKEEYVAQHAAEIEARRKAFGLPPMVNWERAEARARALEGLNTLTNNWGQFEDPAISVKALQNITREAVYQNLFKAVERKNLQHQTDLSEKLQPPKTGVRIAAPDELTLRPSPKETPVQKQAEPVDRNAALSETRPGATPEELQRTSAQPQTEMFPKNDVERVTQRATPANFQKMLDAKQTQKMREKARVEAAEKARQERVKAQEEKAAAQKAAQKAAVEKAKAEREAERNRREAVQRGREGLGLEGERVQRDNADIEKRAAQLRSAMGSLSDQIGKAKTEKRRANLQEKYDAKEEELNTLPEKAPQVRTPIKDRTDVDEAFEKEQIRLARQRNVKENLPSELPSARRGPVVKHVRTGRTEQTGQRKDVVGRADAVTNTLIARRAELAEFKRRVDFLTEKGKPVPQALTNKLNAAQKKADAAAKIQKEISGLEAKANQKLKESKAKYGKDELAREAGGEYESAPVTYLRKTTTEAIRDGRMLDVADDLAEHGSTQFVKDLAERLRPLLIRTKIGTTQDLMVDGKPAGGAYYSAENRIALDDQNMTEEDLVHEMVHAATMRVLRADNADLTPTQRKARDDLQKLYNQIKEDPAFAKEYAKKDLEEFVAEAMSNSKLQDKLANTKVEGESFFDKLKQFIMRMFGVDTRSDAFKTATDAIDKIFKPSAKLEAEVKARAAPTAKGFEDELGLAERIIADKPSMQQQIDANLGLNFRTKWLDRLAPLEKIAQTMMDPLKGTQMMFFLRMADQKMSFTQQAVANGVPQKVAIKRADGRTEYIIESQKGANLANIAKTLGKAPGMNPAAANRLFTLYLAGKRAERVGADVLNFDVSEQDLKNAVGKIEANKELHDVFEDARNQYNEYNRNLVNFLQDMGVISKETAASLSKSNDYIPYYRDRNGEAELVIGGEGTYRVGSLKDQPQLRELIGGNQKIFDFLTSSVQNTSMIMDMGLRNMATKNAMFELQSLGLASFYGGEASGPNVVQFREDGQDRYVRVDTDAAGIPSNLLVKGMEGIPVNNSALVRAMVMPATLLRRAVTMSPLYSARQIFRDSVAAPLTSGADFTPVMAAIKQIGKMDTKGTLESRGIVGGQVFTGGNEDLTRILGEFQSGKIGLSQLVAKAEAVAMEADALTRRAQYDSYIRQGLSEMEATLMSLESMNFNRKGMSPSVRLASTLIPFFNAQLQSLDVLYRAMTGKMPMNERLDIQGKLYRRGAALAGTAIAYTMLMQDDPLYKNAQPDEKYGNFFVHLPGTKEALRVPVPFEIGYIFKSIPEAIINSMASDAGAEDAYKAFKTIAIQTIPGATSGFMPAGVKPLVENATNHSFFTGRELESKAEQEREAQFRYRDSTSELAKGIGAITGTSPIKLENLIRGYTGTMGIAFTQAINAASPGNGVPKPTKKLSEMPVIGAAFQPEDAGGVVSDMYDHMARAREVQKTYNQLVKEGNGAEARQYLQENVNMLATKTMTGNLQETMGKLKKAEMAIKASGLTPDEKRARLDEIQKMRIQIASNVRGVYEKTTPR